MADDSCLLQSTYTFWLNHIPPAPPALFPYQQQQPQLQQQKSWCRNVFFVCFFFFFFAANFVFFCVFLSFICVGHKKKEYLFVYIVPSSWSFYYFFNDDYYYWFLLPNFDFNFSFSVSLSRFFCLISWLFFSNHVCVPCYNGTVFCRFESVQYIECRLKPTRLYSSYRSAALPRHVESFEYSIFNTNPLDRQFQ